MRMEWEAEIWRAGGGGWGGGYRGTGGRGRDADEQEIGQIEHELQIARFLHRRPPGTADSPPVHGHLCNHGKAAVYPGNRIGSFWVCSTAQFIAVDNPRRRQAESRMILSDRTRFNRLKRMKE